MDPKESTMVKNIAVLVGRLRKESYSRKIAKAMTGLFPEGVNVSFLEIGDLVLHHIKIIVNV
jgi:chromate reductase